MPLDLSRIDPGAGTKLVVPRDIFASLPNKPWSRLRLEQGEVLRDWFDRRTERDLVIKQNTGGGKTVIGLLIAQSSLNEQVGPAVYLVPDTYLVQQVVDEAARLGLATTTDANDPSFRSGAAILVATFHKVVNGRSTFGVTGRRDVLPVGTVVVDDAHAALAAARSQFTASVPTGHAAYERLIGLFANELRDQNANNFASLRDGDRCAPMRVPFWAWINAQDKALEILREYGEDPSFKSLYFPWPLIADHLHLAVVTVTERVVEIKTPCPPIDMIPAFDRARRRVYLTATLSDDGVLVTDLAADAGSVARPVTPERAADLGDRMILAPLALNPGMVEDSVRQLARQYADGDRDGDGVSDAEPLNVVVLVPSDKRAGAWEEYADHILHVTDMKPVINQMTSGGHVGLVVLVNKYDGVDLPGDACRMLIIDGIPTPLDASERREAAALAGSATHLSRKVQRLEQGMGRGIRDAEDYCAVLVLGSELALTLVDPAAASLFSPATRAQMALSQQVAEQIRGEGIDAIRSALTPFLTRAETWKMLSSRAIAGVEYDREGHVTPVAIARRRAFDQAAAGDPANAVATLRAALNAGVDDAERGWYLEEVAAYQQALSPTDAQATIRAARGLNRTTLMPAVPLPVRPTRGTALQGEAASGFLTDHYAGATELRLGFAAVLDGITWDPDRTDDAEAAMQALGQHLGFASSRPEVEVGSGPDNLWGLTPSTNAIIELKTGGTRSDAEIVKKEADQLSGALHWDQEHNPHATRRIPVLVHPAFQRHQEATTPADTRVVTPDALQDLKKAVRALAADLSSDSGWTKPEVVTHSLTKHKLTADRIFAEYGCKPVKSPRQS